MNPNSLFAILLRSPWWIAFIVGIGLFALARALLPEHLALYGIFFALPFFVIGSAAAWTQFRAPSQARLDGALEAVRAMDWDDFSSVLEDAFRRQGYGVSRVSGTQAGGVDLELTRAGSVTLVGCKRWKAARAGIGPLEELDATRRRRKADAGIYVATGEVTANARDFALRNNIRLIQGNELAAMLPAATSKKEEKSR